VSPIHFPAHALLILEERFKEQEAEGVKMPEGTERDELALRILIAAACLSSSGPQADPGPSARP
jgi:hypothetical protein